LPHWIEVKKPNAPGKARGGGDWAAKSRFGHKVKHFFADIATASAHQAGWPITFLFALVIIVAWGVTGPIFHHSDTWQLIINTGTTIITFLMVYHYSKHPKSRWCRGSSKARRANSSKRGTEHVDRH
jgi:hypothetical protein